MEFVVILLSSLISLVSPAGFVVDKVAQTTIRKQFASVEQLDVRIDNTPSYQLLQGKVDRIRLAGRGLFPYKDVRLEVLELETDPVHVDADRLRRGRVRLKEPLRSGVHAVVKQEDINQALRSPTFVNQLRKLGFSVLENRQARQAQRYELINPRITLLENQRLRLETTLRDTKDLATLEIFFESGIEVVSGRRFRLIQPIARLNEQPVPERVMTAIATGVSERFDLRQFEKSGITARILHLNLNSQQIDLAAFIQVAPDAKLARSRE
ncbi:DUF2993 domain-containing protein [Kovacikia minuta CCNUW1]|uniref:LmeA family phospholipid-binding protein n=1 Tax=Kovacikia minuta TaxID=2931930 RepID=UPI001CC9ECF2|nr:DUF2993 domain-containing protein [Kovacikia minuta]UBF27699.1 DUF2993 domain-containing protein [Kovacikia minuta CCNUW1]